MRILHPFTAFLGAALALGLFTGAGAAERLQSVVQRVAGAAVRTDANSAKTFRVAGIAVDADGKPVAGVVIEDYHYGTGRTPFDRTEMEAKQRVTTGTDGAFEFQLSNGPNVLLARKPGLAVAWRSYYNPTKDLTEERLVLTPPTTIAGVVVDETDKPVADAEVWVSMAYCERALDDRRRTYDSLSAKPARECFSARTAADGKYVLQGFPTNASVDLAVSKPGKVLREPPREYVGPDSMRAQAGQQDIKLVVEPSGGIEGKVVAEETGQPLAGMKLWLTANRPGYFGAGQHEPAESGADGAFRLPDVGAGSYQLRARFGTNQVPEWVAETVTATVEAGQTTGDVKVSATRGGFLEVAVLGKADRKPVTEAGINAYKEAYQSAASSGSNGMALLRLPAGEYQVSAYKENSRSEGHTVTVENGRTNRLEIELNPPPKITGVVRDTSGAAVPGLQVIVFGQWGGRSGDAKTDANGHYELAWDPQRFGGSQRTPCLIARDVSRNQATAQDIEEGATTLDLRLEPGLVVAGRVEDVDGKPLSKATVRLFLWSGNSGSQFEEEPTETDAQGQFEIKALPPGRKYSLDATAKGYGSANRQVDQNAEANRVEVEPCVLKVADQKLAGEVVDADDKPVARANVYMYGQGQPNGSVRTDAQGRFKFDAVCEGSIQISASSQRAYGNARAQAGDTNVVIKLGVSSAYSFSEAPRRPSLKGKPLPDLAALDLAADAAPAGKPILLCLFDIEQRPSRRLARLLSEQHDALRQKGITVLGLQAAVTPADSLKEWKQANPVPFPVGRVPEKSAKTKWAADVESLPWLILTDSAGRVTAEGFALEELDAKLVGQKKAEK